MKEEAERSEEGYHCPGYPEKESKRGYIYSMPACMSKSLIQRQILCYATLEQKRQGKKDVCNKGKGD
jgi:hypothetical protein